MTLEVMTLLTLKHSNSLLDQIKVHRLGGGKDQQPLLDNRVIKKKLTACNISSHSPIFEDTAIIKDGAVEVYCMCCKNYYIKITVHTELHVLTKQWKCGKF